MKQKGPSTDMSTKGLCSAANIHKYMYTYTKLERIEDKVKSNQRRGAQRTGPHRNEREGKRGEKDRNEAQRKKEERTKQTKRRSMCGLTAGSGDVVVEAGTGSYEADQTGTRACTEIKRGS